ncbi:MAG: efflux transporter outer membrane subunit [Bacteroidales bacterium]
MFKRILIGIFMTLLTGCMTLGPDYQRPDIDMPDSWRFEEKEAREMANTTWWEHFNDPVLNGLVETALNENNDVLIATARVEEFFGRYFSVRGDRFPFIDAAGSASREGVTENGPTPVPPGTDTTFDYYQAFLRGQWELDFWGKFRRANEAARAELISTEEARRTVVLTLVSAVASAYVEILALDKQLDITKRTAETRRQTLDLFQLQFDNGIIAEINVSQAEAEYQDALARIPEIELAVARLENALSVLLGRNPGPIPRGVGIDGFILPEVPSGLPSDLLERRPDIRAAEQALIAANARIGVAKSLYFPTISLTGAFGAVSNDLSDLFTGKSQAWNVGVPVNIPIFTAGRIGGEVKGTEAFQKQTLYNYIQTVQNALREVDDALVLRLKSGQRLQNLANQVKALKNYARLARMRYDEGYTSYLEVLDAERSLFLVELSYTESQNTLLRSLIDIYKSMGGGWVEAAEAEALSQPVMEAGFIP